DSPAFSFTSTCNTSFNLRSIGSSKVIAWRVFSFSIASNKAYIVVDLPQPVGPVSKMIPDDCLSHVFIFLNCVGNKNNFCSVQFFFWGKIRNVKLSLFDNVSVDKRMEYCSLCFDSKERMPF